MKKYLISIIAIALLTACNNSHKFKVEGTIEGGGGEMIYLEHTGLMKSTVIDSTRINNEGEFRFRAERPAYPDFYKLILGTKQIHFAVDSTETIKIESSFDNFSNEYTISGSESNTDIQKLRKSVIEIQKKANQIVRGMNEADRNKLLDEIVAMVDIHKTMARPIILKNPKSTAAYFAIFQKINDTYIFSPYAKEDRPYCAAVATSYHTFMPAYDRSKNLYNLVMDAIKMERQARRQENWQEIVKEIGTGFIDIELADKQGINRKLSDLKGKVVLLDFSAYESRESVQYTFALRDLYNKYSSRGFEIYQVALDRNKLLWQEAVANIPWICVRDESGPNTVHAASYNVTSLPSYFLISRGGDIIGRDMDLQTLEKAIEKQL
ncbi:Thiol-disulfide oxidoreductase ResA [bioreactor metagenome]|uniref:Thiol-disulfide oxidoreductase ResA n=1 Tax=bioreactor metagenome TaxID=1076179 RepID=A0A645ABX1_9ZZZZ|nr:TlpA disulfide reductase family protein [Paludibacter sp.]